MGNVSSSYAVKAGQDLALCSRFNFNFNSYESDVQFGMELWRRKIPETGADWARKMIRDGWHSAGESVLVKTGSGDEYDGVLKAKVDQNWKIGILWEGRVKELLVSIGAGLDLKRRDRVLGNVGLEVSYCS